MYFILYLGSIDLPVYNFEQGLKLDAQYKKNRSCTYSTYMIIFIERLSLQGKSIGPFLFKRSKCQPQHNKQSAPIHSTYIQIARAHSILLKLKSL